MFRMMIHLIVNANESWLMTASWVPAKQRTSSAHVQSRIGQEKSGPLGPLFGG